MQFIKTAKKEYISIGCIAEMTVRNEDGKYNLTLKTRDSQYHILGIYNDEETAYYALEDAICQMSTHVTVTEAPLFPAPKAKMKPLIDFEKIAYGEDKIRIDEEALL